MDKEYDKYTEENNTRIEKKYKYGLDKENDKYTEKK